MMSMLPRLPYSHGIYHCCKFHLFCEHYLPAALVGTGLVTPVFEFDIMLLSSLIHIYIYIRNIDVMLCNIKVSWHVTVMICHCVTHCHNLSLCHDVSVCNVSLYYVLCGVSWCVTVSWCIIVMSCHGVMMCHYAIMCHYVITCQCVISFRRLSVFCKTSRLLTS